MCVVEIFDKKNNELKYVVYVFVWLKNKSNCYIQFKLLEV